MSYEQSPNQGGGYQFPTFSVGSVVSGSLAIYIENFVALTMLGLIFLAPLYLYYLVAPDVYAGVLLGETGGVTSGLITFGSTVLGWFFTPVIIYAVVNRMRGQPIDIGTAIPRGASRILYSIAAGIVTGIGIGLGFILILVPGLILACYWFAAIPAAIIEKTGPFAAIGRSNELTKGYRWSIFGLIVIFGIVTIAIAGMAVFFISIDVLSVTVLIVLEFIVTSLIFTFSTIATAYGYFLLTVEKDGADIDRIAEVF